MAQKFEWLLDTHRRPDGRRWSGAHLARATGGVVPRSYVTNLRKGRIENPGYEKLAAIAKAMGFPPALWFGAIEADPTPDAALAAVLEDETAREILGEVLKLGPTDRRLLLGIARQIASPQPKI